MLLLNVAEITLEGEASSFVYFQKDGRFAASTGKRLVSTG